MHISPGEELRRVLRSPDGEVTLDNQTALRDPFRSFRVDIPRPPCRRAGSPADELVGEGLETALAKT